MSSQPCPPAPSPRPQSRASVSQVAEELWSADRARDADRWTIEKLGIPGIVLMEHAGRAVAEWVCARSAPAAGPICVVVGPGNNGGDGWVAARHLWGRGYAVRVCALRAPAALSGDARLAAEMFTRVRATLPSAGSPPLELLLLDGASTLESVLHACRPALIVDAILGTGLTRAPAGTVAEAISAIHRSGVPVLAVDVPSGLPSDGQAPPGACLQASETITFGARKIAHAAEPGLRLCGRVTVVDIGLHECPDAQEVPLVCRAPALAACMPRDDPEDSHKHRFGHVGILEGARATRGAAQLAAYAALRAGAGLVSELVEAPLTGADAALPECMRRDADEPDA